MATSTSAPGQADMARGDGEAVQGAPGQAKQWSFSTLVRELTFVRTAYLLDVLKDHFHMDEGKSHTDAVYTLAGLLQEQPELWERERRQLAKHYRHIKVEGVKPERGAVDFSLESSACTLDSCRVAGASSCCKNTLLPLNYEMGYTAAPRERDGKLSYQRLWGLGCFVVGAAIVLALLFAVAMPTLSECKGYVRADNCTVHAAEETGFIRGNVRLRVIALNVSYVEEGGEHWLSGSGFHQCGPSFNVLVGEGQQWLEKHGVGVGVPGNATCFYDPDEPGTVVLDRGAHSLALPQWFWTLSGIMFAWLVFTSILCCMFSWYHCLVFLGCWKCARDFCIHTAC